MIKLRKTAVDLHYNARQTSLFSFHLVNGDDPLSGELTTQVNLPNASELFELFTTKI